MLRRDVSQPYQEFSDGEGENIPELCQGDILDESEPTEANDDFEETQDHSVVSYPLMGFDRACLKNIFSTILLCIYLVLTTGAAFLAYQTITDFMEKLNHPVMSVTFKEVDCFEPAGISLYLGKAQLLSCRHHLHDYIPPLVSPGQAEIGDCITEEVNYTAPYSNHTMVSVCNVSNYNLAWFGNQDKLITSRHVVVFLELFTKDRIIQEMHRIQYKVGQTCTTVKLKRKALVVQGPADVRNRELIFLQLCLNLTEEDFSAISYMLFARFSDLINREKASFMQDCERNYSMLTFSGGFRTWVKMSLVKTSGKGEQSVEFRQESGVVKYNDRRPNNERTSELFFVVFQWRDPFIQEVQDIVTANPWNTIAILCGVFLALFKAADFAKQSVKWMIKIRKRHLKRRLRELNNVS